MPSRNTAQRLQDILDAVERAFEIISEASRRLPDDVRNRHPEIDWRALAGLGNVYRHDYDAIDAQLMWASIEQRLDPLQEAAEQELRQLRSS